MSAKYRFETFVSEKTGLHHFAFKAPNNEGMDQSEGYATYGGMLDSILTIKRRAAEAPIVARRVKTPKKKA